MHAACLRAGIPRGKWPLKCIPVCSQDADYEHVTGEKCCTAGLGCAVATALTGKKLPGSGGQGGGVWVLLLQQLRGQPADTGAAG